MIEGRTTHWWIACLVACGAAQAPATTDEVTALRARWLYAFNEKRVDAVMAAYADDAVFLPITGERLAGAPAIRALYAKIWQTMTPHLELQGDVRRSGDVAYETGTYREVLKSIDGSVEITGGYVFAYRRGGDGWRIAAQIWTQAK